MDMMPLRQRSMRIVLGNTDAVVDLVADRTFIA